MSDSKDPLKDLVSWVQSTNARAFHVTSELLASDNAKSFLGGIAAGVLGAAVGYPLDTSKTRTQSSATRMSLLTALKQNYAEGGVRALFKGAAAPITSQTVFTALHFGVYDSVRVRLRGSALARAGTDTPVSVALAGGAAGLAILPFNVPFEVVKVRAQMDNVTQKRFRNSLDVLRHVVKTLGVSGLYRGTRTQFFREFGYGVSYFSCYLALQDAIRGQYPASKFAHVVATPIAGGIAGAFAWAVVFPWDVVKTRIQVVDEPQTARQVAKVVYQQHGVRGFYQGLVACSIRALIVHAVRFSAFEVALAFSRETT
jgi:hypothetical protein